MKQADKDKIMDSIKEVGHKKFLISSMKSREKTSTKTGLPLNWIAALFKKFQARYLHKWTSAIEGIEDLVVTEWSQGLAGLTGEQISLGIDSLHEEWPPTVMAFRALCEGKGVNGFNLNYTPECYRERNPEKLLESDEKKESRRASYSVGMTDLRNIIKTKV